MACLDAQAQDRELATRQELIAKAQGLSAAGKHDEALPLLRQAAAIRMTTSLRMFVAQEEAAVGKIADAYGNSRQCATEADADEQLHDRARILAACQALEQSLSKRVGRIVVNFPPPLPADLHVRLSGEDINVALLGTPYVVSPGAVTVTAQAPGFLPFSTDLTVPEGGSAEVNVRLTVDTSGACPAAQERVGTACVPACAEGKARSPADAAQCCWPGQSWDAQRSSCVGDRRCPDGLVAHGDECFAVAPAAPTVPSSLPAPPSKIAPLVVGGAGVVVGAVGTIIWLSGNSKYSTLKSECNAPGGCSVNTYDSASSTIRLDDKLGVTGWIAGGTLVSTAAIWYVVQSAAENRPNPSVTSLFFNPATKVVGMAGAF